MSNGASTTNDNHIILELAFDYCAKIVARQPHIDHVNPNDVTYFLHKLGVTGDNIRAVTQGILEIMMAYALLTQRWQNYYDRHYCHKPYQWIGDDER